MFRILFALIFVCLSAHAEDDAVFFGHNLTPTTDMMKPGIWSVGDYAVARGFEGNFFIATSPWIWVSYNTANIHFKWVKDNFGIFGSYFQSLAMEPIKTTNGSSISNLQRYYFQSMALHALYSYQWNLDIKTNFSLKYSHFWYDYYPFSIRMDPGDDATLDQVDLTSLTFIRLQQSHYYWGLELGSLGLNYHAPYLHFGTSISYLSKSWLVLVGTSYTAQFKELMQKTAWTPGRSDGRLHYYPSGNAYYDKYLQTALHPELQIQYFF